MFSNAKEITSILKTYSRTLCFVSLDLENGPSCSSLESFFSWLKPYQHACFVRRVHHSSATPGCGPRSGKSSPRGLFCTLNCCFHMEDKARASLSQSVIVLFFTVQYSKWCNRMDSFQRERSSGSLHPLHSPWGETWYTQSELFGPTAV